MTPAEVIADLDASLREDGEDIRLQRLALGPGGLQIPFEVTCRAFVRGYQPQELVAGITQQDKKVILSPTQIVAASWTSGRSAHEDARVPMKGNRIILNSGPATVQAAAGLYVAGTLARLELQVRG